MTHSKFNVGTTHVDSVLRQYTDVTKNDRVLRTTDEVFVFDCLQVAVSLVDVCCCKRVDRCKTITRRTRAPQGRVRPLQSIVYLRHSDVHIVSNTTQMDKETRPFVRCHSVNSSSHSVNGDNVKNYSLYAC